MALLSDLVLKHEESVLGDRVRKLQCSSKKHSLAKETEMPGRHPLRPTQRVLSPKIYNLWYDGTPHDHKFLSAQVKLQNDALYKTV